jgi:D-alanine-D-alanine ligase
VHPTIAIIYSEPSICRYRTIEEEKAELSILDTVEAVHSALADSGYSVARVSLLPPIGRTRDILKNIENGLVFNLFEGFDGYPETEAVVADIMSEFGLIYTGCPPSALSLDLDKARAKGLLEMAGIDTPRSQVLNPGTLSLFYLGYPCIVKPCGEDASHGLSEDSVVNRPDQLARQVAEISEAFGGRALVEEFVDGRELNITVFGNGVPMALPVSEIVYSLPLGMPRILTFSAKWEPQSVYFQCTKVACPAEIDTETEKQIKDVALRAFRLFDCSGYARVDLRLGDGGSVKILEVNPNPDIAPDAGAARQALAAGMTYNEFIEKIALFAQERANCGKTKSQANGDWRQASHIGYVESHT